MSGNWLRCRQWIWPPGGMLFGSQSFVWLSSGPCPPKSGACAGGTHVYTCAHNYRHGICYTAHVQVFVVVADNICTQQRNQHQATRILWQLCFVGRRGGLASLPSHLAHHPHTRCSTDCAAGMLKSFSQRAYTHFLMPRAASAAAGGRHVARLACCGKWLELDRHRQS